MSREQGSRVAKGRVEYLNPAGMLKNPAFTQAAMVFVAGLGHPDFLLELDAVAVVPEQAARRTGEPPPPTAARLPAPRRRLARRGFFAILKAG